MLTEIYYSNYGDGMGWWGCEAAKKRTGKLGMEFNMRELTENTIRIKRNKPFIFPGWCYVLGLIHFRWTRLLEAHCHWISVIILHLLLDWRESVFHKIDSYWLKHVTDTVNGEWNPQWLWQLCLISVIMVFVLWYQF